MKHPTMLIFLILTLALLTGCHQSYPPQSQSIPQAQTVNLDLKIGATTKDAVLKKLGNPSDSRALQGDDGLFEYFTYQGDTVINARLVANDHSVSRKTVTRLTLQFLNGVLWNAGL
jgi:outer membrane protein assembly factor BamE (lipoprotein component of BamABCDE complex)